MVREPRLQAEVFRSLKERAQNVKRITTSCLLLLLFSGLASIIPGTASAAPISPTVDFDTMLSNLPTILDEVLDGNWSGGATPFYQRVGMSSPNFVDADLDGNGINDDDQLAMLELILNEEGCLSNIPSATQTAIKNAYATTRDYIENRVNGGGVANGIQITLNNVQLTENSGTIDICTGSNYNITTGTSSTNVGLNLSGLCWLGSAYTLTLPVDSLWGEGNLLHDASATGLLDDYVRDLAAAYITMGDYNGVSYPGIDFFQKLIAEVVVGYIPVLIDNLLPDKSASFEMASYERASTGLDKYTVTCSTVPTVDINYDYYYEELSLTVPLRIYVSSTNLCNSINGFIGNFVCGTSRDCSNRTRLAYNGDMNQDGTSNRGTYQIAGGNRDLFLSREWIYYPNPITFSTQPVGNIAPNPVVVIPFNGSNWPLSAVLDASDQSKPHSYQWYRGTSPGSLSVLSGATSRTYTVLSSLPGTYYYQLRAADPCGTAAVGLTNIVGVKVEPPNISVTGPTPSSATLPFNGGVTLTVNANNGGFGTFSYAWKRNVGSGTENIGSNQNTYVLSNAVLEDAGSYWCVVSSVEYGNSATSGTSVISVSLPTIDIDPQPVGGSVPVGGNYTLSTDATIAVGGLTFEWEKDGSFVGTGKTFDIIGADPLLDVGYYRCKITSGAFSGYFTYTNNVFVSVGGGTGAVFRVDKYSPMTGGVEDGLAWDTAFDTIQEGIDAAAALGGGEVWVAGGPEGHVDAPYVYNETRTENWGLASVQGSLVLKDNVELYGGFEGYQGRQETVRVLRGVRRAVTIIDGSVSRPGGLPAYHVVVAGRGALPTIGARIDGFEITGGNASGLAGDYHTWRGGGIYNWQSPLVIANCTIHGNSAATSGGGLANETGTGVANATVENCVFWANTANRLPDDPTTPNAVRGGGGVFNNDADATFSFCTFYDNTIDTTWTLLGAASEGMYQWKASPVVNSCVFDLHSIGAIQDDDEEFGTEGAVVSYSNVEGADPLFATTGPEFYLSAGSAALINQGDPSAVLNRDLPGAPRPQNSVADIGAYEYLTGNPTAVCANTSVSLDSAGDATVLASSIYSATSTVPGGLYKILINSGSSAAYDCNDLGANSAELGVVDFHGNIGVCNATVTVLDDIDPTAVCTPITVQLDASGSYTLTPADIQTIGAGSSDNCAIDWTASSVTPNTFDCTQVGDVTVTLGVVDTSGNQSAGGGISFCATTVTVEDILPPTMVCKNITVPLDAISGTASIVASQVDDGSSDNCELDLSTLAIDVSSFDCADVGTQSVTLSASDVNGNSGSCVASVTVDDVTGPVFTGLPKNAYVLNLNLPYTDAQARAGVTATDVCTSSPTITITAETLAGVPVPMPITDPGSGYPVVYKLIYSADDGNGNVTTNDLSRITIVDDPPPTITILGADPFTVECGAAYNDDGATAEDEGNDITDFIVTTGLPVDTTTPGTYTVVYTVTDGTTEVSDSREVNVVDTTAPTIALNAPATVAIALGGTYTVAPATATDVCEGSLTGSIAVGGDTVDVNTPNTYVVTFDVSDSVPNAATQVIQTIYVLAELLNFTDQPDGASVYVDDAAFDLSATFAGGQNVTTYEWKEATLGVIGSGTVSGNTVTLSFDPSGFDAGTYLVHAEITDVSGVTLSDAATIVVADHMSITDDIADATIVFGDPYAMTVTVIGGMGDLTYQWYKDGGPINDTAKAWTGTDTATLSFPSFSEEDEGTYQLKISDDQEEITSSEATLTGDLGMPVAGLFGLAALAGASALSGVLSLRRRERR